MTVKQKTHQATAKRLRVTKRGKVTRHYAMQDHFNVGRPKKVLRKRRRDQNVARSDLRHLERVLPFGVGSLK